MSIVIGSIMQETNSFCPVSTSLETFDRLYGEEMVLKLRGTRTEVSGFLDVLAEADLYVVPTLSARAISGGNVTAEAHLHLQEELLSRISAVADIEGVLLAMHGAMVAEGCDDTEGETLKRVREIVGPNVPIAVSLDPHAHVSQAMVEAADILVSYRTFPHVDQYETGKRTANLFVDMLAKRLHPVMEVVRIPVLTSPEAQPDDSGPMAELLGLCRSLENEKGIRSVSYCPVQPWLDIPGTAQVALVVADKDRSVAKVVAETLAERVWELRDQFVPERLSPKEAIRRAIQLDSGCIVMTEPADAPPAGAPGDSAFLLRGLLEEDVTQPSMVTVVDPEAVEVAYTTGQGNPISVMVGHKLDPRWGEPVLVKGNVRTLSDGEFFRQMTGTIESMGRTAVIQSGAVSVVLCENSFAHLDPNSYISLGLDPSSARIVGVKSTLHFRAFYKPIATEIILLDTPGPSSGRFETFNWQRISRPMWPLDNLDNYLNKD
jgi:microcystin degradation protein MlrC